jgi:hypothetical protein
LFSTRPSIESCIEPHSTAIPVLKERNRALGTVPFFLGHMILVMGRKIFVGNLSFNAGETELRQLFEQRGGVETVTVMRNTR